MTSPTKRFAFGAGAVVCDTTDGTVVSVTHPAHPHADFILPEENGGWHQPPFRWGKGFIITEQGSARWDFPDECSVDEDSVCCVYWLLPGLQLTVERRFGERWTESYTLDNIGGAAVNIGSLAISTPFHDVYYSAAESLRRTCHAHVWTGGSLAWVWAARSNGEAQGLGLAVTAGELWSYSIESRNYFTGSNVRGHIYLHVTDWSRAPHAMGGQQPVILLPGGQYRLEWSIGWFDDFQQFDRERVQTPFTIPTLAGEIGQPLSIALPPDARIATSERVSVARPTSSTAQLVGTAAGVEYIDILHAEKRMRVGVLFHRPVREIVEKRIEFILEHQRATERDPDRRGAFLPYDNRSMLRINGSNWQDWSDGRERMAMPLLLQQARLRGWGDSAQIDAALSDYARFCRAHLVDGEGSVFENSYYHAPKRLYNFPWLAQFFLGQHVLYYDPNHAPEDCLLAARIIERYYELDGRNFLSIGGPECAEAIIGELRVLGFDARAAALERLILDHAEHFVALEADLPPHEVNYEQSIVTALVSLFLTAYRLQPRDSFAAALHTTLAWLRAFAGEQPHIRLRHIPIRHWDGFWFGSLRQYGDIFPHYWSILSAAIYARFPAELQHPTATETTDNLRAMAEAIFAANLVHFHDDGAATCAFVYPGCIDGNPGYTEDPQANDQDWALVYLLRLSQSAAGAEVERLRTRENPSS